jgi:hypothetical protein
MRLIFSSGKKMTKGLTDGVKRMQNHQPRVETINIQNPTARTLAIVVKELPFPSNLHERPFS